MRRCWRSWYGGWLACGLVKRKWKQRGSIGLDGWTDVPVNNIIGIRAPQEDLLQFIRTQTALVDGSDDQHHSSVAESKLKSDGQHQLSQWFVSPPNQSVFDLVVARSFYRMIRLRTLRSSSMNTYCIRATALKIYSAITKTKDADVKANKSHPYLSQGEVDERATQTYVARLLPDATIFSKCVTRI